MSNEKITKKQRDFINNYLESGNGAQAAIEAGYPEKSAAQMAYKLLNTEKISNYLSEERARRRAALGIDENWSVLQLKNILERCLKPIPVLEWDENTHSYSEMGKYQFDSKGALGAIKEINNLLGIGGDGEGGNINQVMIINDYGDNNEG